jgi:hypothetical protein
MNERSALELRVAALIRAYADRAPNDVDPMAIARLVATGSRPIAPVWFGLTYARRGLAFALVLIAVLVSILSGALISGALPIRRDPVDILVERAFVEPFVGLPPEGAAPSTPEIGELVLSFGGRVHSLGLDFHRMWLYADGRLIWKSNLEGSSAGWKLRFGSSEPTTAVIEQRLTPEGVDLIRSYVHARVPDPRYPIGGYPTYDGFAEAATTGPGVLWGYMSMPDGDQIVPVTWSDYDLPGRLADPASWLPASAWEDLKIGAYVPSRYAVCLGQAVPEGVRGLAATDLWHRLPEPTRNLIRSKALEDPVPDWNERDPRCLYQVSTDDARVIAAAFAEAGPRQESRDVLGYEFPIGPAPIGHEFSGYIELLVVLPNGEVVCHCG